MKTLEADIEINPDGSLKLLAPLPSWIRPGRAHILLTLAVEDVAGEPGAPAGIEKTPGVNGGDACISCTRIPVWVLVEMRREGSTEAEILADFPDLTAAQLAEAWVYAEANPAEIEEARTAHAEA